MKQEKILGVESAYIEALRKGFGKNMSISTKLFIEIIDHMSDLENDVIDLKSALRTCQNTSNTIMKKYDETGKGVDEELNYRIKDKKVTILSIPKDNEN